MSRTPPASSTVATETRTGRQPHQRRTASKRRLGGVTTLMYAAQQGDVDRIKKIILKQSSKLSDRDRTGKTPLHYCCNSDNVCAAQGADIIVMAAPDLVDGKDEDGFTPLHLAVIAGNMQLVTFLLANNADVNAVDNEKHTVVHWATVCGETSALRAVLAAGAPVSTPDIHGGYPLHYAAQMCGGDKESSLGLQALQVLLASRDASVSVRDGDQRPPLLWAASAGSAKAVLALVQAGAAVEAADRDGLTALHCAASRGHTDCLDTLLTLCGASADVIDSNGCTALHYAVTLGHADATTLLLAHGADPNRQDRKGRSPAHCGCAKGQFETVKLIGSHKANLWLRNARGDLPLHDAAASGRRELVKWLLELRPSYVNARNNDGRCPLHMAALHDNADMCKILLDTGAQINPVLRTSKNILMTPLDCALLRGFRSTAKFLQLHGGMPASRLSDPRTRPLNSALNLHIRDDVTLLGDTSTDSERENGLSEDRKLNRKKVFSKLEKKMTTLSDSDMDPTVPKSGKSIHDPHKERSSGNPKEKRSHSRLDASESTRESAHENLPSSRLDYTNEIIINGKTEINIRQTGEIIFDEEQKRAEVLEPKSCKVSARRPRSAKYSRLKKSEENLKSVRERATSPETIIQQQQLRKPYLKDQSTNTSEETVVTVIENKKFTSAAQTINEEISSSPEEISPTRVDQQSIISVTSEDAEDQRKDLVVEVAVHAPPESSEDQNMLTTKIKADESVKCGDEEIKEPVDGAGVSGGVQNDNLLVDKEIIGPSGSVNELLVQESITPGDSKLEEAEVQIEEKEEPDKKEILEDKSPTEFSSEHVKNDDSGQDEESRLSISKQNEEKMEQTKADHIDKQSDEASHADDAKTHDDEDTTTLDSEKNVHQQVKTEANIEVGVEKVGDQLDSQTTEMQTNVVEQLSMKVDMVSDEQPRSLEKERDVSEDANNKKPEKNKRKKTTDSSGTILNGELKKAEESSSLSDGSDRKSHKSFRILDEEEADQLDDTRQRRYRSKKAVLEKSRSRSVENKPNTNKTRKSKIPKPLFKSNLSKSDKHLDMLQANRDLEMRVPSLPNISDNKHRLKEPPRCESNMSAPLLTALHSDNERDSISEVEASRDVAKTKRFVKKRPKTREARSAGSDYESSNVIDSGFEPSPRSTRVPKWRNMTDRGVNMTSVTQNIQNNIRRYHLERKIFQQLLELKRSQIRAGQHNESILVKRAIDTYHQSCASTVGAGQYVPPDYTFKSFEKFLYEALRKLQKNGTEFMKGLPASTQANPLLCTRSTNRCMHAAHAYTGVPCAAYLPKLDHHSIPKIGFNSVDCKPGSGFLPRINPKKAVTLELSHGNDKQIISLPTEKLDENKRYYVTFTVKGHEAPEDNAVTDSSNNTAHRHSRSN